MFRVDVCRGTDQAEREAGRRIKESIYWSMCGSRLEETVSTDVPSAVTLYPDMKGWEAPDLPQLDAVISPKSILDFAGRALIGQLPVFARTPEAYGWLSNLVRLCDKAANEYQAGRDASLDFAANMNVGKISPFFRAIDHLESCVNALHRALLHAERIKRYPSAPPMDRTEWRALHDATRRLKDVRDAIEHTEEKLTTGELPQGQPQYLWLRKDHLSMGGHSIGYAELAAWIRRVYQIMDSLLSATSDS